MGQGINTKVRAAITSEAMARVSTPRSGLESRPQQSNGQGINTKVRAAIASNAMAKAAIDSNSMTKAAISRSGRIGRT